LNTYWKPIPHSYTVPFLLVLSIGGSFLTAAVYPVTVGGVSLLLYLCCAIGGSVGALAAVVMNPFMTSYTNFNISGARSGGSAFILICALLSIVQNPGASNQRFSVSVYFTIMGAILIPSIFAYYYITMKKVGLRDTSNDLHKEIQNEASDNPMVRSASADAESVITGASTFEIRTASEDDEPSGFIDDDSHPFLNNLMNRFTEYLVSEENHKKYPWLRRTIPYMLTVGWVDFNTWGIVVAMMPFAIAAVSGGGSGSENLAVAYEAGAIALVCGDLSTTFMKLPLFYGIIVFTAFAFTIYIAALQAPGYGTPEAAAILIIIFTIQRFIEAHLLTTSYRSIATRFPPKYRQVASRWVGTADQFATTSGAILSTLVVSLAFSCSTR